jgi:asparagine synthase (glutamine-hydrolysing)
MCGINGIYSLNNLNKHLLLKEMNSKLTYRGPDQEGFFSNSHIALGMRRLSIIDLNTGNQPLFNNEKNKCIIFNGEIYNYKQLKLELEKNGVEFSTKSDTEVILQSYIKWGENCLEKFRGMFSLAIYDILNEELFLARDAFGEKPLYFTNHNNNFIFSSELRPILHTNLIPKTINQKALQMYFQLGYIPSPFSIIENIQKLRAGHWLKFKNNKFTIHRWYNHYEIKTFDENKNNTLIELIETSVKQSLVADVPVGVFLSGGIDSSIISFHANKLLNQKLNSFSLGFSDKDLDETKRAKFAAKLFNTTHHLKMASDQEMRDELKLIISKMDEPISDTSFISTYLISRFASKNVKVILTGDGGDELFGGYEKYLINSYSDLYNSLPFMVKAIISFVFKNFIYSRSSLYRKYIKLIENAKLTPTNRIINTMILNFKPVELESMLIHKSKLSESLDLIRNDLVNLLLKHDLLTSSLLIDQVYTLEGCMLPKVDRASMLNSLETRSPLLNIDLVRYVNSLDSSKKISVFTKKAILKTTYRKIISSRILNYKKRGFTSPIHKWLNIYSFINLFDEKFINEQGLFNYEYIKKLLEIHLKNKENVSNKIWTYIVFQNWYNLNIK